MFANHPVQRVQAVAVPLIYGIADAIFVAIYCLCAWKANWTKAPSDENICIVLAKSYEFGDGAVSAASTPATSPVPLSEDAVDHHHDDDMETAKKIDSKVVVDNENNNKGTGEDDEEEEGDTTTTGAVTSTSESSTNHDLEAATANDVTAADEATTTVSTHHDDDGDEFETDSLLIYEHVISRRIPRRNGR